MNKNIADCIFCNMIAKNDYDIFYRNELFVAVVDVCPKNVGHFLILPVRHIESIYELTGEEILQFNKVALDIMSNNFHKIDLIGRYKHFIDSASESDTKAIERCRNAIDFINMEVKLEPSGFSCGFNEGSNSGKEYEHLHMHVVPAYKNRPNERGCRSLTVGVDY
jgi:diadenosine tetraphosphate (Ap4A) HIT family hydrolase